MDKKNLSKLCLFIDRPVYFLVNLDERSDPTNAIYLDSLCKPLQRESFSYVICKAYCFNIINVYYALLRLIENWNLCAWSCVNENMEIRVLKDEERFKGKCYSSFYTHGVQRNGFDLTSWKFLLAISLRNAVKLDDFDREHIFAWEFRDCGLFNFTRTISKNG